MPGYNLQPSEIGKVLLVVSLSGFLVERMREMGRQTTARVMLLGLIPTMVVLTQSDLGSALVDLGFAELRLGTDYSQGDPARVLRFDDVRCSAN